MAITSKSKRRREDADDDRILADGARLRVPMTLMDASGRRTVRVDDVLSLNRPGFRYQTDSVAQRTLDQIYNDVADLDSNRWRNPAPQSIADAGNGAKPGDRCSIDGEPGRLNEKLECVPDDGDETQDGHDERAKAYREVEAAAENAWRNPR